MTRIDFQSGKSVDLFNPQASDIDAYDIARGLANKGHFGGHSTTYFSIAEHSILVSYLTDDIYGLLHDAPEAYLFDPSSCYKQRIPIFKEDEQAFLRAISERFKLDYERFEEPFYKFCDVEILKMEFNEFYPNGGVNPPEHKGNYGVFDIYEKLSKLKINYYTPKESFEKFLDRLFELLVIENK